MRSRTDPSLTGRCHRCWVKTSHCVCARLPLVQTTVRILVVRHVLEGFKSTNSARIAALVLPNLRIVDYGAKDEPFDPSLLDEHSVLVYPPLASSDAPPVRAEELVARKASLCLVVPDANWNQARRMAKRLNDLRPMPRLELPPTGPRAHAAGGLRRLRQSAVPDRRSTFETLTEVVALLEGPAAGDPLRSAQELWVAEVLRARGRLATPVRAF